VDISNVAHIDPETGNPTRIKYEVQDGKKVRVAKSGKLIIEPEIIRRRRAAESENE
jgi:large subunit ribosomal protein L24